MQRVRGRRGSGADRSVAGFYFEDSERWRLATRG